MAKPETRIAGRTPSRTNAKARAGSRWQPVAGPRVNMRVAGRKPLRLPKPEFKAPTIALRWRRATVLTLAAAAALVFGMWLYRTPALSIRHVGVEGNAVLSTQAIEGMAGLDGQSLFRPDFAGARQRLLAIPVVKDAQITHDWPWGAHITVVERVPWGVWQAGAQSAVIDNEGVVLDLPAPAGAPVIVQTGAPAQMLSAGEAVDGGAVAVATQLVATAEQTLGRHVARLEFSETSGLTAIFDGDLRVQFGDAQGYEFKVAALYAILQQAQNEGRTLHKIDLRFGDRVAAQ